MADASEMAETLDIVDEGMVPVCGSDLKDGNYKVNVRSSSGMFKITDCELTVRDGKMTAVMTMSGTGYSYVYMGTGAEAAAAPEASYIPYAANADGAHTFTVPVEALDKGISCAAFSKKKEKWYDRTLLFEAASVPASALAEGTVKTAADLGLKDGSYKVDAVLGGGSGRTTIESPAELIVKDGKLTARIIWSSNKYDFMVVDGETCYPVGDPVNKDGNSEFLIPVEVLDHAIQVKADTTAMSKPYLIDYTISFDSASIKPGSMELDYAEEFAVDYYDGNIAKITIADRTMWLKPDERPKNIYIASSSVMDYFLELDALDHAAMTGTPYAEWKIPEIRELVYNDKISFVGKYNAPDIEYILSEGCDLAIENTMIYHSPEILEELEAVGIPVLVERSSYEKTPLGRLEWIKLYGLLCGEEEKAEELFKGFEQKLGEIEDSIEASEGVHGSASNAYPAAAKATAVLTARPTAAYFYINTAGGVIVRDPGDYMIKMLETAGGRYVPEGLKAGSGSLTVDMESFYSAAKDADVLIYNGVIDEGTKTVADLIKKAPVLSGLKAVKEGRVYRTGDIVFQKSTGIPEMTEDMNTILYAKNKELKFFEKME
ncbi:MAG: ABC transporter substrate-binding protein [Eubacteriales bacterium]|nr:ABC transporter substrate-binding protein [Eubacteriales bacterium]